MYKKTTKETQISLSLSIQLDMATSPFSHLDFFLILYTKVSLIGRDPSSSSHLDFFSHFYIQRSLILYRLWEFFMGLSEHNHDLSFIFKSKLKEEAYTHNIYGRFSTIFEYEHEHEHEHEPFFFIHFSYHCYYVCCYHKYYYHHHLQHCPYYSMDEQAGHGLSFLKDYLITS